MRVHNRIKTIMWRVGFDALASRVNLMKRKVITDAVCRSCGVGQETTLHTLWTCPALVEVWTKHFVWLLRESRYCSNFLDAFLDLPREKQPL